MKLKIGHKVFLSNKSPYIPDEANPTKGSKYFCYGKVDSIRKFTDTIVVRWDNGRRNSYYEKDLERVETDDDHNHPLTKIFK